MSAVGEARGGAFARAALLGNPSDAYGGATIAVTLAEWSATARAREARRPRIEAADADAGELVAATVARFGPACRARGVEPRPVALGIGTTIPRQAGLGGSSAIVIATLRALCALHRVEIEPAALAELALAVEVEELGIAAGLQDRVAQAYGGLVEMDFAGPKPHAYRRLDPALLPPLFVAVLPGPASASGEVHARLRGRFERDEPGVRETVARIAALVGRGTRALLAGDREALGRLMAESVRLRGELLELDPEHLRLVELAAELGAPANYAGSGGAIVGVVPPRGPARLLEALGAHGCELVLPRIAGPAVAPNAGRT